MSAAAAIAAPGRNLATFLLGFVVAYGALASVNAIADPFADFFFLTHWRPPRVRTFDDRTDIRFKSALVRKAGRDGLDAAIVGSSRVMSIDPETPELRALAPRALNLGVQGARLGITRQFVEYVARRNPRCLALVGLDFFAFYESPLEASIFLDESNPLPAWRDCLGRLGSRQQIPGSWEMLHGFPVANQFRASGLAVRARREPAEVDALLARFAEKDWQQSPHFRQFRYDPSKLEVLRALQRRLPRVVFFTNPATRAYYEGMAKARLDATHRRWLADLGEVGGVIDFTGAAAITDDPRLFNDMHHYHTEAGALILRDIAAHLRGEPLRLGRLLAPAPRSE
jgi:hypothetical protein